VTIAAFAYAARRARVYVRAMARPLRLEFPGAIYHVTARGNAQGAIFLDDHDREGFLALFARVVKRYEWVCHAFCLMGNHFHLVVETPRPSLAAGMRQLNGVYAQTFNHRHRRSGHVFGERFKSVVVEKDEHLVAAAAYVVNNPVRAGLCGAAVDWAYSSYRATAGVVAAPAFLTLDWLLSQFAGELHAAQARYRTYVAEAALRHLGEVRGEIYLVRTSSSTGLLPTGVCKRFRGRNGNRCHRRSKSCSTNSGTSRSRSPTVVMAIPCA
jgi:REP element-mobilizing transposase RayT